MDEDDDSVMDLTWYATERTCPECGAAVLRRQWWDDPPSMGGGHIGTQLKCDNEECDWWDDE